MGDGDELLTLFFPKLPPTSNKIYFMGTRLRREAVAFGEEFARFVVDAGHGPALNSIRDDWCFHVQLEFYFPALENKPGAKSRYKRIDLDNRVKLVTDCLRDAMGIDDCQIFSASQEKHQIRPTDQSGVGVRVRRVDPGRFGLSGGPGAESGHVGGGR